jgi:hypothetical protein
MRPDRSINWHMAWPDEQGPFATGMIERINIALQKPIQDLDPADLRQLIGQQIALEYTVPLAIGAIRANPMQSASYYEGDLLQACLKTEVVFWTKHPDQYARLKEFFQTVRVFDQKVHEQVKTFLALEIVSVGKDSTKKVTKRKPK